MKNATLVIVAVITIIVVGIGGYLYLRQNYSAPVNSADMQKMAEVQALLNQQLGKLQNDISHFQEIISQQSMSIQQLREDNINANAQVVKLERKFDEAIAKLQQILAGNNNFAGTPNLLSPSDSHTSLSEPSLQGFSPELFKDPEFAKLFQDQVNQAIQDKEKKDREEQMSRFTDRIQEMVNRRVEEFAKAQNLNDFQKQELNKLVQERSSKTMELLAKMRTQDANPEDLRAQQNTLRSENNEKIKQVLLPEQYEEYLKIEAQFSRGGMMGGGGGARNAPAGQINPAPPQAPAPR